MTTATSPPGGNPAKRVKLPMDRRRNRPRVEITVTEPGVIVIDQGKRVDRIDGPPGTSIDRPLPALAVVQSAPMALDILPAVPGGST